MLYCLSRFDRFEGKNLTQLWDLRGDSIKDDVLSGPTQHGAFGPYSENHEEYILFELHKDTRFVGIVAQFETYDVSKPEDVKFKAYLPINDLSSCYLEISKYRVETRQNENR
jgi:hypothetical protein